MCMFINIWLCRQQKLNIAFICCFVFGHSMMEASFTPKIPKNPKRIFIVLSQEFSKNKEIRFLLVIGLWKKLVSTLQIHQMNRIVMEVLEYLQSVTVSNEKNLSQEPMSTFIKCNTISSLPLCAVWCCGSCSYLCERLSWCPLGLPMSRQQWRRLVWLRTELSQQPQHQEMLSTESRW